MADPIHRFPYERLDAYHAAVEFMALANGIIGAMPRGRGNLADQLERAGMSILLNIAEGAGELSGREKARFYRMALRSASECGALLDLAAAVEAARHEGTWSEESKSLGASAR